MDRYALESITESPLNPRRFFDEEKLAELAASIKEQGILQALVLRPHPDDDSRYELVIGARRFRAAALAGLTYVPAAVLILDDAEVLEVQLVENDQRDGVSPLDEALAIRRLNFEHGRSPEDIADKLGRPVAYIRRRLVLTQLRNELWGLLEEGRIGLGSGELLGKLSEEMQGAIVDGGIHPATMFQTWSDGAYQDTEEPAVWSHHDIKRAIKSRARSLSHALWRLSSKCGKLGPCDNCPKRSDAQTSLIADEFDGEAQCMDPSCWDAKADDWAARKVKRCLKKGAVLLKNDDIPKEMYSSGLAYADQTVTYGDERKWGEISDAPHYVWVVEETYSNLKKVREMVKKKEVREAIQGTKHEDLFEYMSVRAGKTADEKTRLKKEVDDRHARMALVVAAAESSRTDKLLRHLVLAAVDVANQDPRKAVCQRRGWKPAKAEKGFFGCRHGRHIKEEIATMKNAELRGLLVEITLTPTQRWTGGGAFDEWTKRLEGGDDAE